VQVIIPEELRMSVTLSQLLVKAVRKFKADAKAFRILRFGSTAVRAAAFKIQHAVKVGMVTGMDVGVHGREVNNLRV